MNWGFLHLQGPKCQLTFWQQFIDLYLLPILVSIVAIVFYYLSPKMCDNVKPKFMAILILLLIFFFIVYIIDRFLEYWRYELCSFG